ncbi:MAG: DUF262 domain-containing protein [Gammaproteobacteria bacterium]|nr:DUF262 domain-containing protein [Gammaproteobacteria bacterium]
MQIEVLTRETIQWLMGLKKNEFLKVNHEYQRAPVWKKHQEQMFIDSVFRGYSIPAFYFHHQKKTMGNLSHETLYIIDGQQRINALYRYYEGAYDLLDPQGDTKSKFKFPNFVQGKECPWAGKRFNDLNDQLKERFLQQKVVVYQITTDDEDEIRDLFIRLQGGIPLNAQEKRDSWPGKFADYVCELGGKHGVEKYPGHEFFTHLAKPSGGGSNKRKLAAQIAMLYFNRRETGLRSIDDIKSVNIDNFYHQKINFDSSSDETKRFEKILKLLIKTFQDPQDSKILKGKGHYAIGLVLLVDSLLDSHVRGWESKLRDAFIDFHKECLAATKAVKDDDSTDENQEYYNSYVRWASTQSDVADTIQKRHNFFVKKMLLLIDPTQKDHQRNFTSLDKEIIYYRDRQRCQVCQMRGVNDNSSAVPWDDAEIHHVNPHSEGGMTTLDNGALVHKSCHPRSVEDVAKFLSWWEESHRDKKDGGVEDTKKFPPPEGTVCRFKYGGEIHEGKIKNRKLVVKEREYLSFSAASCDLTGTSRNGWSDWWLALPDDFGREILADDWRRDTW